MPERPKHHVQEGVQGRTQPKSIRKARLSWYSPDQTPGPVSHAPLSIKLPIHDFLRRVSLERHLEARENPRRFLVPMACHRKTNVLLPLAEQRRDLSLWHLIP